MSRPKPEDRCKTCGHAYSYHAGDVMTTKERCWHGSATGDGCALECKEFLPEVK